MLLHDDVQLSGRKCFSGHAAGTGDAFAMRKSAWDAGKSRGRRDAGAMPHPCICRGLYAPEILPGEAPVQMPMPQVPDALPKGADGKKLLTSARGLLVKYAK